MTLLSLDRQVEMALVDLTSRCRSPYRAATVRVWRVFVSAFRHARQCAAAR